MTLGHSGETRIVGSLSELEGETLCWTLFAGRPLRPRETSTTRNTIQLPDVYQVVQGKLKNIFSPEKWIGDSEDSEWQRAEEILIRKKIRDVWSPITISTGSILLDSRELPEYQLDGEIYRYEGIQDTGGGSNPENMFRRITIHPFIAKTR